MKILKKIANILLIILISIGICLIIIGNIILSTLGNKGYILDRLEKDNYYSQLYEMIYDNFQKYMYQSGFDENILYNVCSIDDIKNDVEGIINNLYEGKGYKIDTSKIRDNIMKNISKKIEIGEQNSDTINEFVNYLCEEYENAIVHIENINYIFENLDKYKDLLRDILKFLWLAIIGMLIILIVVNKKHVIIDILIICLTTLFLCIDIIFCILYNIDIENIQIFNECFSNEITMIIKNIISIGKKYIYGLAISSALLLVIIGWLNINKKDKDKLEV